MKMNVELENGRLIARDGMGNEWLTHDCLMFGDYGGAGDVGLANIQFIQDNLPESEWFLWEGGFGSKTIYLKPGPDADKLLKRLDEYPAFDDGYVSEVESEWEKEAWDSWLQEALVRAAFPEAHLELLDWFSDEPLWPCYKQAMDDSEEYVVSETNGIYVDVRKIKDNFRERVLEVIKSKGTDFPEELAKRLGVTL